MKQVPLTLISLLITFAIWGQKERGFYKHRIEAKDHIALVIGNSAYKDSPLSNPKNDAIAVAQAFKDLGFVTEIVLDANKENIAMAIDRFSRKLKTARAAVFYFAGHGMQVSGENYLIPISNTISEQITKESQVPYRAINVGEILSVIEANKVKFSMVVLDACRNNPIKSRERGKLKGLAAINAPVGSMIMYSTKAGDVAEDGTGENSPFTLAFLKHLKTPGLDVNLLPMQVTKTVHQLTNGAQTPGSYVQLTDRFTFVPELTEEELEQIKKEQQSKLSDLQAREVEIFNQKQKEEAELAVKQAEIDALDEQIEKLKDQSSDNGSDLDKMLAIVRQKEMRKKELVEMRLRAERERVEREKEIIEMKKAKLSENIAKYKEIASSEFGNDMKLAAWNSLLLNLGLSKGCVKVDDFKGLRFKLKGIEVAHGTFTDNRDAKSYKTVTIGDQTWMAENLAYKTRGGCWAYKLNKNNIAKYGYLYNWKAAVNVCPTGWRLPSKDDFVILLSNLTQLKPLNDGSFNLNYEEKDDLYTALIEGGASGFSALFGGIRIIEGRFGRNYENALGRVNANYNEIAFLSSTQLDNVFFWGLIIRKVEKADVFVGYNRCYIKNNGHPIRCIKEN